MKLMKSNKLIDLNFLIRYKFTQHGATLSYFVQFHSMPIKSLRNWMNMKWITIFRFFPGLLWKRLTVSHWFPLIYYAKVKCPWNIFNNPPSDEITPFNPLQPTSTPFGPSPFHPAMSPSALPLVLTHNRRGDYSYFFPFFLISLSSAPPWAGGCCVFSLHFLSVYLFIRWPRIAPVGAHRSNSTASRSFTNLFPLISVDFHLFPFIQFNVSADFQESARRIALFPSSFPMVMQHRWQCHHPHPTNPNLLHQIKRIIWLNQLWRGIIPQKWRTLSTASQFHFLFKK